MKQRSSLARIITVIALIASFIASQGTWALAGTTGGLSGTIVDASSGQPLADAHITATSPSETATTTSDAGGHFSFLNLAPDTYTIAATKSGYADVSLPGVTVFADQVQTLAIRAQQALKQIANVRSNSANNLVKSGTTSDVYSVNAATQQVVSGSGGGLNLNSAYSAIYSQPGVTSSIGNYGWGQVFYIRGSAYSQIGYEFDGVPVNRAFDNYQANSLSNLGQQELQVYTGGSPSGASSATLGGFINQVIKTGTYPGSGTLVGGIGTPSFFHELKAEAGGANPARTFSYYVGLNGFNQWYPFWNSSQGNNISNNGLNQYGFTAPATVATIYNGLYCINGGADGAIAPSCADGGAIQGDFTNGPFPACQNGGYNGGIANGYTAANPGPLGGACWGYGVYGAGYASYQEERNTVMNFHFAVPHKTDGGRDDIQLLYDNSMQSLHYNSDINSNGGLGFISGNLNQLAPYASGPWVGTPGAGLCGYENVWPGLLGLPFSCAQSGSPLPYLDSRIWAPGTQFGSNAATSVSVPYYFPNTPANRSLNDPSTGSFPSGIPQNNPDAQTNDVGIVKLQYTKNMGSNAYARLFGYTFYSDWLLQGADCAAVGYLDGLLQSSLCGNTADYELTTHTRGAELQLADQINPENLLQFTANYTTATVARWNNSNSWIQGYVGSRGSTSLTTLDPNNPVCYSASTGDPTSCFGSAGRGNTFDPTKGQAFDPCAAGQLDPASPACAAGAKWYVTTPSGQGTYNTVTPKFTSLALQDEFRPNTRWDLNLGVRYENYTYQLPSSNNPEFNFWFNAAARVSCYDPVTQQPIVTPLAPGQPWPPTPIATTPMGQCGLAPSGQEGLHPVGKSVTCDNVTTFDCGPVQLSAAGASSFSHAVVSPRIGGTYTMGPNDVLRFSVGKYTQPTETAFEQYLDQSGKRAAQFDFSRFWGLGFTTPTHDNPVQYSNNYDFSFEHRFENTDWSMKLSPFYRDSHNEIVTVPLGPGFVSGVNVGHQHSYGVELAVSKGDPTRDGLSGQLSYTYTKALIQYGNLPNGTNSIDYLNNYIKAFNALTQAGGGAQCYAVDGGGPAGSNSAAPGCVVPAGDPAGTQLIANPYYGLAQQQMLDRNGYYPVYPNEPPGDPFDQGSAPGSSAISPHLISGWLQWKHGKLAIAPNFELLAGTYYGSPTDTYGIDPRVCFGNQGNATTAQGTVVAPGSNNCDYLQAGFSPYTTSGFLAIPNPYSNRMDQMGTFQEPWQFNLGALIRYDISPKMTLNLTLANLYNRCFGGSSTPWSNQFKPNNYTCGYYAAAGSFIGKTPGAGYFWGNSPTDAVNGTTPYAPSYNYPFAPYSGAQPFQVYAELQIKI